MDTSTFAAVSSAMGIVAPLALIIGFAWVIWRTRSRHVLFRRVWQLVHGNQEIADPAIRAFVDDENSLATFNMFSGVWVGSLDEARDLICWTKRHNIGMWSLRLAGEYFDAKTRLVHAHKLPSSCRQKLKVGLIGVSYTVGALCLWAMLSDSVPLTLKATQRTYLATNDSARTLESFWPYGSPRLYASDCSAPTEVNAARTAFSESEVKLLCDVLGSPDSATFIKAFRSSWRWSLFAIAALAAFVLWNLLMSWLSAEAAAKLARRQLDPSLEDPQRSLEWGDAHVSRQ